MFKDKKRDAVTDPIGLGTYTMDSHNTQRFVATDAGGAYVENEGDIQVGIDKPYGISYRALAPMEDHASNLLVSAAISASHIAYGSMRMEPTFMVMGQAAGTAAVMGLDTGTSIQQVDYDRRAGRLAQDRQILKWGGGTLPKTPIVGTLVEDFNYGPDDGRVDLPSYTCGGWAECWGPGKNYTNGAVDLSHAPAYGMQHQLMYDAPGYTNSPTVENLISGGAGTKSGSTMSQTVSGRGISGGMQGTIWLSALVRIDTLAQDQDALIWLDRDGSGNVDNSGDAFVGLRKGGTITLRHSGGTNLSEPGGKAYAAGAAHLLLVRIDMNQTGGTDDAILLWIDPDLKNLLAPNLSASGSDLFGKTFDGIGLSIGPGGGTVDAIRISNEANGFDKVTMSPKPHLASGLAAGTPPAPGHRAPGGDTGH